MIRISVDDLFTCCCYSYHLFGCFSSPILISNNVIYPHNNIIELNIDQDVSDAYLTYRKFTDIGRVFIPRLSLQLSDNNYFWIPMWVSNVELGRPLYQHGFGKANMITHGLSFLTNDPYRVLSLQAIVLVWLTAFFVFGFLREIRLHPIVCLAIGLAISTGAYFSYWLGFSMFIAPYTWSFGIIWLSVAFINQPSWTKGFFLVVVVYHLLTMSYPQTVIAVAYPIIGFILIHLMQLSQPNKRKIKLFIGLGVAAICGALAALPLYLDMYYTSTTSLRLDADIEMFLSVLPKLSIPTISRFFQEFFDPFWLGNPISSSYTYDINGHSFTPFYTLFFFLSLFNPNRRQLWFWHVFFFITLVASIIPQAYELLINYFGFGISSVNLVRTGVIFGFIPIAITLDHILKGEYKPRKLLLRIFSLIVLGSVVLFGYWHIRQAMLGHTLLRPQYLLLSAILLMIAVMFIRTSRQRWLLLGAVLSMFFYGGSLMLLRPMESIYTQSPLVDTITQEIGSNSRYAWIGEPSSRLTPNMPISFGVSTIHTHNSLTSHNYADLMVIFGEEPDENQGRDYKSLQTLSAIDTPEFSYTGVELLLSMTPLEHEGIELVTQVNDVYIYRLPQPILATQITNYDVSADKVLLDGRLEDQEQLSVRQTVQFNDYMEYNLTPTDQPSLLFISQQYNRFWNAMANGESLESVVINDFYQGIVIPAGVETVSLEYRSLIYYLWIPQALFLLIGLSIIGINVWKYLRRYFAA